MNCNLYGQLLFLVKYLILGGSYEQGAFYGSFFHTHLHITNHKKSVDKPTAISPINLMPTLQLLDHFTKKGLEQFIYFSTQQTLGRIPSSIIGEDFLPKPLNNYGLTHLLGEQITSFYDNTTDAKCINVRLSNGYGAPVFQNTNCWWLVINDLCKIAFEKNKIQLLSDGSPQRDFIHVSDVCRAVEVLITSKDVLRWRDNVFHIASGNTLTILELAHEVKKVFDNRYQKDIPVILPNNVISEEPDKCKNIDKFVLSTKNMEHLGFRPTTDLIVGIEEMFSYLENREKNT